MTALTAVFTGATVSRPIRWGWTAFVILLLIPSAIQFGRVAAVEVRSPLNDVEVQAMVERDLAHWLANRSGPASPVVLSTPALAGALSFHGSIRGVATLDPENQAGLQAAIRITSASSIIEAQVLMEGRTITHLVIPSWDLPLDELARTGRQLPPGRKVPADSFMAALHRWALPPWLRPVPYHLLPPDLRARL